jgi:hypothetical protein
MSFAQGFAAGSAAAQRGLNMAEQMRAMEERQAEQARQERLRQEMAGLARQQEVATRAQTEGMAVPMSPVQQPQTQYSPEAQAAFGLGGPAPMMSSVAQQAPSQAMVDAGLASPAQVPITPMSTSELYRQQAMIQSQYGDPAEATRLLGLASAEERAMAAEGRAVTAEQRAAAEELRKQGDYDRDQAEREGLAEINRLAMSGAGSQAIRDAAAKYNLGVEQVQGVLSGRFNLSQTDIAEQQQKIINDISTRRGVDSLIDYYNKSEELTPGYSLSLEPREGGGFNLLHKNDKNEVIDTTPFSSKAEADLHLRRLAADPITAQAAIVDRDIGIAKAGAEAKFKQLEIDAKNAKLEADVRTAFGKEAAALRSDRMFAMLPPGEQDARINALKADFGIGDEQGGLADRPEKTEPELSAVQKIQMEDAKQREAESASARQAQQDARIIASLSGARQQEALAVATPEAKAAYQAILDEQARQQQSATRFYGLQQSRSPYTGM